MSALRIRRVVAGGGDAAVELTPLIDMIFLLLVFFLVVTTFRDERRALEVELPAAASADRSRSEKPLTIEIGPDRIAADGTVIPPAALGPIFSEAARARREVVIASDRRVSYERFVGVLDASRAAGLAGVALQTAPPGNRR